jgi:hypothetical protein
MNRLRHSSQIVSLPTYWKYKPIFDRIILDSRNLCLDYFQEVSPEGIVWVCGRMKHLYAALPQEKVGRKTKVLGHSPQFVHIERMNHTHRRGFATENSCVPDSQWIGILAQW